MTTMPLNDSVPREACGDYPAPCNCDNPETHDGAAPGSAPALAFEYGYAVDAQDGRALYPEACPITGRVWYATKELAERARVNDLRFRFPLVLVKRLVGPVELV